MNRPLVCTLIALASLTGAACASSGGGGGGGGEQARFTRDLGRVIENFMEESRLKVWTKHGIPVFRSEVQFRAIMIESEWMPRDVLPEEAAAGVLSARNRIILRGRRVGDDQATGLGIFRYTYELDNQVRTETLENWQPAPMSNDVIALYRPVLSDLEMEVRAGVRR